MASCNVSSHLVVDVLEKDAHLLRDCARLINTLRIPEVKIVQVLSSYKLGVATSYDVFKAIIDNWVEIDGEAATLGKLGEILKEMNFLRLAEYILKLGDPKTQIVAPPKQQPTNSIDISQEDKSFNISPPIKTFVGREDEIVQLKDYFKEKRTCVVTSAMGGQGKSQLCKKFVERIQEENSSQIVTWFQGDTYDQLVTSISEYAERLDLQLKDCYGKRIPANKLIKNIGAKLLPKKFPWLVVIDNVDSEYDGFPEVVQEFTDLSASVLITTRCAKILHGVTEQLKLKSLSDEDAYKLVHNALKNVDHADVQLLCKMLGNHALACAQAVAYIRAQQNCSTAGKGYKISDYIAEFNKDKEEPVKYKLKLYYDETIYIVVNKTMKYIRETDGPQGEMSQQIMDVLCLVRPDGIEVQYLHKLVGQYVLGKPGRPMQWPDILDKVEKLVDDSKCIRLKYFKDGLTRLQELSLISVDYEVVSVHRIVQKIAKIDSKYAGGYILIPIVELENTTAPELRHIISIWESIVNHDKERAVFSKRYMPHQIFSRMIELNMVTELVAFAKTNYDLLSTLLGKESILARRLQFDIGWALREIGKYQDAIDMFETMLATRTRDEMSDERFSEEIERCIFVAKVYLRVIVGKSDENIFDNLSPMLSMFLNQSIRSDSLDFEKPLQKLVQKPEKQEAIAHSSGAKGDECASPLEKHRGIMTGCRLMMAGKHSEAVTILREEYMSYKTKYGEEHWRTLGTMTILSYCLWKAGNREEALQIMREVVTLDKTVWGPDHHHTLLKIGILHQWEAEMAMTNTN
ncbi:uncharacterized protein LOC110861873 [Folsomia candida]|uniref:Phosphoserine aminotransferase n=1 Tax=Folsomia candida TaxID=158441 RepID=A0A226CYN1_FOLCA|nr:uncharacterized protein LOC110861873 [Folsomia candida]XP_035700926.1 uncharacterized protein LOC110861873 [Folsomia candida]XP_035700927.1 uncharacterized protein LOC110861873 [Folsomia candida]XP_035700928.1 uncharacterized protein LOC110861873 [Folsomia candida]XP_035700929.1 uncharacterized protein LOC110861873 [Folsomia candida]XP_035700930.1 uncharacterized protein LOC110861873 [Folsomia candida]OXA38422.1 Phosphoserine aminotransferase [Folsomia candida]